MPVNRYAAREHIFHSFCRNPITNCKSLSSNRDMITLWYLWEKISVAYPGFPQATYIAYSVGIVETNVNSLLGLSLAFGTFKCCIIQSNIFLNAQVAF